MEETPSNTTNDKDENNEVVEKIVEKRDDNTEKSPQLAKQRKIKMWRQKRIPMKTRM